MNSRKSTRFSTTPATALPRYIIACEGKTEAQYFGEWARRLRGKVILDIYPEVGVPVTLVEFAKDKANSIRNGPNPPAHLHVWCVGDCDAHPRLPEALDHARRQGIKFALSIPCLELWFVLHFQDQTSNIHRHKIISTSKKLLNVSDKNLDTPALDALFSKDNRGKVRMESAILRAKRLKRNHAQNGTVPFPNPSSDLFLLIEELRKY